MKTLREVLFERHQQAEPGLDAIREQVVAGLTSPLRRGGTSALQMGWRQLLWSLRWHLAGLSAAWVIVLLLNMGDTPGQSQAVPRQGSPSPRQLLAALRENQRQLRELISAPVSETAPEPPKLLPSPRSENRSLPPTAA
jgi:hypothetical protein